MRFILLALLFSNEISASELNFKALKVDTSVSDLKAEPKKVAELQLPQKRDEPEKSKEYRPSKNYPFLESPFGRPATEMGLHRQEQSNRAARGFPTN